MNNLEKLTNILSSLGVNKVNETNISSEFSNGDFRLVYVKNNERKYRFIASFKEPMIDHMKAYGDERTSMKRFGVCLSTAIADLISLIDSELFFLEKTASKEADMNDLCSMETAEKLAVTDERKDLLEKILIAFETSK